MTPISTVGHSQAEAVNNICAAYIAPKSLILDCTWGEGLFWAGLLLPRFRLIGSDISPRSGATVQANYERLPFANQSLDAVFFDPPYYELNNPDNPRDPFKHFATTDRAHFDSTRMRETNYLLGCLEHFRVLKPKGLYVVKTSPGCVEQNWLITCLHPWFRYERDFIICLASPGIHRRSDAIASHHDFLHVFFRRAKLG